MPGVEQPIEIAGPPSRYEVDPDLERRGDRPNGVDGLRADVASFEPRDERRRHPGSRRQVGLPPVAAVTDLPDGCPQPLVVH
jgi:hypothetical protein